jgi:glycosyltransferase involved in cell wall biosynthesis
MQREAGMRILIATGIFPPDIGGPATYVPQMAAAFAERGHQITVLTLSDRVDGHDYTYSFRVVRLPRRIFKPWRWLRTAVHLVRLGRHADVLFVNGLAAEAVLANFLLRKPMVQKVVGDLAWERATNRGWVMDGFESFQERHYGLRVEALKALRTWWTRQANKVIVPSRYLARWVRGWGVPDDRIAVIYNAVEPVDGIRPAEVPLQTPIKVVTVGRLVAWKQVDQIIEAIARCDRAGLLIVGDGPERGHLEELVRTLDLADRVYFAGQRNRAEISSLVAACDLFVLNSSYEGFPHVVLEAMNLALPVVATEVGGTPEVVQNEENGVLIAPKNNGALSDALLQLVSSPLKRQRLAGGAKHTVERFRLSAMIEETEAVLWNSVHRWASDEQGCQFHP